MFFRSVTKRDPRDAALTGPPFAEKQSLRNPHDINEIYFFIFYNVCNGIFIVSFIWITLYDILCNTATVYSIKCLHKVDKC
jgi:hypothetical protein